MESKEMLKIALQTGAMKPAMLQLFTDAHVPILQDDPDSFDGLVKGMGSVRFRKSAHIPEGVLAGEQDCGITGVDVIYEQWGEEQVIHIAQINLARRSQQSAKVVLVGKKGSIYVERGAGFDEDRFRIEGVRLFVDPEYTRIASEIDRQSYSLVTVIETKGTSEERIRGDKDFAIVAIETGSTLAANGLCIVNVLMECPMVLFVKKSLHEYDPVRFERVQELGLLLQSVAEARGKCLIKMNVPSHDMEKILALLPALQSPTFMPLTALGFVALESVVPKDELQSLIPRLKAAGASGIIVSEINQLVI